MAATTTIKLPPKLKARVTALARKTGRSTHSFIVEAVERLASHEEKMQSFVTEALARALAHLERSFLFLVGAVRYCTLASAACAHSFATVR
jgi:predicted transcriptional regulator